MAAIANAFELLGDGDDDVQQLAAKAPVKKQEPAAAPAAPAPKKAPAAAPEANGRPDSGRGGRGGRGGERGGRGAGRGFGGRGRGDQPAGAIEEGPAGEEGRGEGGRGRGPRIGGSRGGRGGRGAPLDGHRPPKREFERRDGTGRGHELQKRGGAGVGNWGTDTDAKNAADEATPAEAVDAEAAPADAAAAPAEGAEGAPAAEAPAPEPEPEKEMTLEEYEKLQAEKRAALNKVAEVKNIAVDEEFKGMKAYVRKDPEDSIPGIEISKRKESGKLKAEEPTSTTPKDKPKKQTLETGFRIGEAAEPRPAGRGGRGGRGEGRGDRPFSGRGEGRGDRGDRPFGGRGGRGGEGGRGDRPFSARGPPGAGRGEGPRGPRGGKELPINDNEAFPSLA